MSGTIKYNRRKIQATLRNRTRNEKGPLDSSFSFPDHYNSCCSRRVATTRWSDSLGSWRQCRFNHAMTYHTPYQHHESAVDVTLYGYTNTISTKVSRDSSLYNVQYLVQCTKQNSTIVPRRGGRHAG